MEYRNPINIYMEGTLSYVVTDHKPLTTILGPKWETPPLAAARLQRWVCTLSTFNKVASICCASFDISGLMVIPVGGHSFR